MSTHSLSASPRNALALSESSLAHDNASDIVLTKYACISGEQANPKLVLEMGHSAATVAAIEQQVSENNNNNNKLNSSSGNKLWSISGERALHYEQQQQQQQQQAQAEPHTRDEASCELARVGDNFQILWSDLAFQVDLSAYDNLINGLLKATQVIRSPFSLGGGQPNGSNANKSQSLHQLDEGRFNSAGGAGNGDKRVIFENLNGFVNSGEVTAILGPSGAGKTSLLNALCGRTENYTGRIQLIGAQRQKRMRLSIIPQKDYLIESLTVRENLLYSSKILNADKHFDHEANIMRVVKMLNLTACFNSMANNISGGEYKRVSIAQELLRQPDILILDEPTSGLDSLNCKNLIRSLAGLIKASRSGQLQPIAIVLTIHQPDIEIFHMFDHVYCMARGGRVIFDGHPREAMRTIRSHSGLGSHYDCQESAPSLEEAAAAAVDMDAEGGALPTLTTNPANLLIEIASEVIYGQEPIERLARLQRKQLEQNWRVGPAAAPQLVSQLQMNLLAGKDNGKLLAATAAMQEEAKSNGSFLDEVRLTPNSVSSSSIASSCAEERASSASSSSSSSSAPNHLMRDKRLQVKTDHSGRFWYHTRLLASRTFVSTLRDPFLTMVSLIFHLSIPFVMWSVYPSSIGSTNACPAVQRDMDMVSMMSNRTSDRMENLVEELSVTFESSTMFFITTYSFSMCALTIASLAFPLNMHILLKEVRNGWYGLNSYVLAKTLANFPFEVVFPTLSLVMIYLMLGMPTSLYEWRLVGIALVMVLVSMISHTQGLIFGALCMDSVQTAIFLSSSSSLPQVLLSGFTARIKRMPVFLQKISWSSQYRYSSDLINMLRFGFGICPCDSSTEEYLRAHKPDFVDVPAHLKPLFSYYLTVNSNNNNNQDNSTTTTATTTTTSDQGAGVNSTQLLASVSNVTEYVSSTVKSIVNETTTAAATDFTSAPDRPQRYPGIEYNLLLAEPERNEILRRLDAGEMDMFARMADMTSRSLTYGRPIDDCSSVRSQLLVTADTPPDSYLPIMFGAMFALLMVCKICLVLVVRSKIGSRV